MKKFFLIFIVLVSTLVADRDGGPYIGVGYTSMDVDDNGYYNISDTPQSSYKIALGAFINKYFSVALEYQGDTTFTTQDGATQSFSLADINAQAHYPFYNDTIDTFLKFGAGEFYQDGDKGFCMVYGAGVGYRFNQYFGISGGYDYVDVGIDTTGNNAANHHIKLGIWYGMFEVQF